MRGARGEWRGLDRTRGRPCKRNLIGWITVLANHLASRGPALQRGQVVTTGSCTGVHFAARDDEMTIRFQGFPPLTVAFERKPRD